MYKRRERKRRNKTILLEKVEALHAHHAVFHVLLRSKLTKLFDI